MGLKKILETWRDYPQNLIDGIVDNAERPGRGMLYLLACPALPAAEALIAAKMAYYVTRSKALALLSAVVTLYGRGEQFGEYVETKSY